MASEIEETGGRLNAYTSREHTCFYARVIHEELPLALDTLCDLVCNPLLRSSDIAKERKVINEEIRSYFDDPEENAYDAFSMRHFNGQGLAYPIAGDLSSVSKIGAKQLRSHHKFILEQAPVWVVAAGNVDHQWLVQQTEELLATKTSTHRSGVVKHTYGKGKGAEQLRRDVKQSNIVIGASVPCSGDESKRAALGLFNRMFGGASSSRLFQSIREKHGLAYSVYSALDSYRSCRAFTINLGTNPLRHEKVVHL